MTSKDTFESLRSEFNFTKAIDIRVDKQPEFLTLKQVDMALDLILCRLVITEDQLRFN